MGRETRNPGTKIWEAGHDHVISILGAGQNPSRTKSPLSIRAGYRSVFFDTIFVSIQIDRYLIYHLIHALKTVIYEIFVKSSRNGAVLSFIVFSTLYNYLHILKLNLTIPLRLCGFFLETPQLKRTLRHSEKQEKFEMT